MCSGFWALMVTPSMQRVATLCLPLISWYGQQCCVMYRQSLSAAQCKLSVRKRLMAVSLPLEQAMTLNHREVTVHYSAKLL